MALSRDEQKKLEVLAEKELRIVKDTPKSEWYKVTLDCGHFVYTRIRLCYEKPGMQNHRVRCPACPVGNQPDTVIRWNLVINYEAVPTAEAEKETNFKKFVTNASFMRLFTHGGGGNPLPYTSKNRDY